MPGKEPKKKVTIQNTSPAPNKAPAYPGTGVLYDVERMLIGKLYYYIPINITNKTDPKVPDIIRFYGISPEDIVTRLSKVNADILKTGKITPKEGFSANAIAKPTLPQITPVTQNRQMSAIENKPTLLRIKNGSLDGGTRKTRQKTGLTRKKVKR
ncbi:hypothetical protein EBR66_07350 [bacterium]|nr:hypothetical protein [bacterium]